MNEMLNNSVGLLKKLKTKEKDNESIGEKLVGWIAVSVIVLLLIALFVIPLIIYFIWSHAYVLVKLWAWFIVPIFQCEPLTWAQAWGLMIAVAFLTHVHFTGNAKDERESHEKIMAFVILFLKPWIVLVTGWVCAHYFLHLF